MGSGDRTPERFLPPDPRVEEPYRLTPQLAFRVAMIGFLALAVFAVLFLRLWALQVLAGDKYLARANDNRVRTLRVDAPRGTILDRNGHTLVSNVAGTRLELWPADLPKRWPTELKELRSLAQITGIPASQMLQKLKQHGTDPLTPVVVQSGLHEDQILYLEEHQAAFPGVQLARSWLRRYPYLLARRAGARLRRPDLAGRVQAAEGQGLSAPTTRSARPASSRPTTSTCAVATARRS